MDRFTIMKSFTAVARCGSFATAARSLSISRALVSRHIADLEKQVGIRLLNRTTRSVTLTEPGITYLEFCRRILAEIADQDAQMSGMKENAEGNLSVASPKWIGSLDLGDAVAAGQPLYSVHGETRAELEYSLDYVEANPAIVMVGEQAGVR